MTLLMLVLARAYAPLGARGALIDAMRSREVGAAVRRARSSRSANKPFISAYGRRHAGAAQVQDDRESLAA